MKLPSLTSVVTQASLTLQRFPFAIASAVVGTLAAILLTHHDNEYEFLWMSNIGFVSGLGISFQTALVLLGERNGRGPGRSFLLQLAGIVLLLLYYFSLPADIFSAPIMHVIRFVLLAVGVHLLVAVIAFFARNSVNGFWQFNKTLFLRFLTGALYSAVLFGGLALALAALEHLFGIPISERSYADLWFVIAGVFNTWFVLAGVPADLAALNEISDYPKGLKFFTQFILLPIVTIYLVILYAYMGKILITWNWPQGWVSGLVLGFSITGILSLLLVHPIKDVAGNVWIKTIARWFYLVLIPLAIMMMLAVWRRISDYGVTESRYVGIVVGLWLIGISIYFVLSSNKNIKLIPITLCIISFLISFGPWGAFQISLRSQMQRLREVLARTSILVGDKVRKVDRTVPFDDALAISSIVNYVSTVHSDDALRPLFDVNLDTLGRKDTLASERDRRSGNASRIVALMGVNYVNEWQRGDRVYQSFTSDRAFFVDLRHYSYAVHLRNINTPARRNRMETEEGAFTSAVTDSTITILFEGTAVRDSVVCNATALWEKLFLEHTDPVAHTLPSEKMSMTDSSASLRVRIYFHTLNGGRGDRKPLAGGFDADVYFGKK